MRSREVSSNGYDLKPGDEVKIIGNIEASGKIISINQFMRKLINNDLIYTVEKLGEHNGCPIIKVDDWWWSCANILKINCDEPSIQNETENVSHIFDIERLDI